MYNTDTELLFPSRIIKELRDYRGKVWQDLVDDIEYHKQRVREMLPVALDGLYELAVQSKNERIKLAACESIIDREGQHAKVSRIGLPTQAQGGIGTKIDDEIASNLATALLAAEMHRKQAEQNGTKASSLDSKPASIKIQ